MCEKYNILNNKKEPNNNIWALFPVFVFISLYLFLQILNKFLYLNQSLSKYFLIISFSVTLIVTLFQYRNISFKTKIKTVLNGISSKPILTMMCIFILAGIFAGSVGRNSATSVAYFLLSFVPGQYNVLVIFLVSCIVSLAMGTSVGSITLITPIAISVSEVSGSNTLMCVASCICGSMFGDNLSIISDTAIAACLGVGCKAKEKFIENSKIVVPAALVTTLIMLVLSYNNCNSEFVYNEFNLLEFIPYVLVLILSVCGINVLIVIGIGIISGISILILEGKADFLFIINGAVNGIIGMIELIIITLLVAAIAELIKYNGGFNCILKWIKKFSKNSKIAQLSLGFLVCIIDAITANNTVAIVIAAPIAKEVSQIYSLKKRRVASIIDTYSCIIQGLLPYGAQMLVALSICQNSGLEINVFQIIPLCIYQFVLLFFVLMFTCFDLSDKISRKLFFNR